MTTISEKIFDLERQIDMLRSQIMHLVLPMQQLETTTEGKTATVQFGYVAGGKASRTQLQQQYGFWSRPLADSVHTVLNVSGKAGSGISIASSDERYRPLTLLEGDAYMGDNTGQRIWLTAGNTLNIVTNANVNITAPTKVTVTSPNVECTGDVRVDGNLTVVGDIYDANTSHSSLKTLRDDYNAHTHGGIQTGGGSTSVTNRPTP